jgi:hypothetical protein
MPTVPDPAEPGRLLPEQPQADVIFQMLQDGQQWRSSLPTLPPGKVQVKVLNGTGVGGLAGRTAARLRKLGYDVTGVADAAPTSATTVTYSGTAQADSAYTLMTSLKASPAAQDLLAGPARPTGTAGPVTLVLGSDFAGLTRPPAPRTGKPGHGVPGHRKPALAGHASGSASGSGGYGSPAFVQSRNAGSSICSGLPASNPGSGSPP